MAMLTLDDPLSMPDQSVPSRDYRFTNLDQPCGYAKIYLPSSVHVSVILGGNTVVWRYATILEGTVIGQECLIGACCFIGRYARIGDGTRVHHGAAIPDGAIIGDRVFIGSHVTLADVAYPNLTDKSLEQHRPPVIEDGAVIGANAVILPGVVVHAGAVVGAGAVVTRDVQPGVTVAGNPARRLVKARLGAPMLNEAGDVLSGGGCLAFPRTSWSGEALQ